MEYPIEIKGKNKRQVTKINLSGKGLREIPTNVYDYFNLEKLDLSHNRIKSIPKDILKLRKLRSIDLSFNDLSVLQSAIFQLPKLRTLNLHGNKLKSLPKQIADSQLDILILSKNQFKTIDMHLIEDITKVDLADNPMCVEEKDIDMKEKQGIKTMTKNKMNIFISYSHQDEEWLKRLKVHLNGLAKYYNTIDVWDDKRLRAGDRWNKEITKALCNSNVALLLVSANFIASDYIQNNELQPILKKAENNGVKIIPIFVSPVAVLDESGIGSFQGANNPTRTLSECTSAEVERILANLMTDIKSFIQ